MAAAKLGVDPDAFLDRLPHAVDVTTLLLGVGKAPVFAAIIVLVGCFQGLRTARRRGQAWARRRRARSCGRSSALMIVWPTPRFSIVFSMLGL